MDVGELGLSMKPIHTKATRALVNDIMSCGSLLCEALNSKAKLQEERWRFATMNTDVDEIEHNVRNSIKLMEETITTTREKQAHAEVDEKDLYGVYEKRRMELDRSEKRLATFMNVRPAYMDEYEQLQKELQGLFSIYFEKFRNLQWLESQLENFRYLEQQKYDEMQCKMRRLQRHLHDEDAMEDESSNTPSIDQDIDDGDSDNIF